MLRMNNAVVLGGTNDHIKLINLLKELGYFVYLIDYYDMPIAGKYADRHIKGSTLDREFVLEKCKELNAKLCLALCIDQALLTMAYVAEQLNLPCHISFKTALALTNKVLMKHMFLDHNIPSSKFISIKEDNDALYSVDHLNFPVVVKPADANSSKGIEKVIARGTLKKAIDNAFIHSKSKQVVIEEYKEGIELSVDVIISDFDPLFILITENIKRSDTPENFTIVKNIFRKELQNRYLSQIKLIAGNIAKAYGLRNSPLLIQLLVNNNDISVIEFSARVGGGSKHYLIQKITGFDILRYFLAILRKEQLAIGNSHGYAYASMNYVYTKQGTFDRFEGDKYLKENKIIEEIFQYKQTGVEVISSAASTDRPLGFMIVAETELGLHEKTREADNILQIFDEEGKDIMIHGIYN